MNQYGVHRSDKMSERVSHCHKRDYSTMRNKYVSFLYLSLLISYYKWWYFLSQASMADLNSWLLVGIKLTINDLRDIFIYLFRAICLYLLTSFNINPYTIKYYFFYETWVAYAIYLQMKGIKTHLVEFHTKLFFFFQILNFVLSRGR